jgi:diadenosine tetraphosphate (Ap4A) HIT family hydrolase
MTPISRICRIVRPRPASGRLRNAPNPHGVDHAPLGKRDSSAGSTQVVCWFRLPAKARWPHAIALADADPVVDSHMVVAPRKRVSTIHALTVAEQKAIWDLVAEVRARLLTGLKPDGFAIGFCGGPGTGQTDSDAHLIVVPCRKDAPPAAVQSFFLLPRIPILAGAGSPTFRRVNNAWYVRRSRRRYQPASTLHQHV